jgi:hypothetical protein
MENKSPELVLNPSLYQIFLMNCHCGLPISFAKHHWLVVNRKGVVTRWDVLIEEDHCGEKSWGHLHLNAKKPFEPLGTLSITGESLWKAKMEGMIEGGEGSLAEKMANFIENSPSNYPFCYKYSLLSPNSNSYIQWVLNHFPEFKAELPWNAFGKGHRFGV